MVCSRKSRRALYRIKQLLKFTTVRKQDRKERRNIKRHVKSWEEHLAELRGDEFKRRYRMPQETFNFLLETIASFFQPLTSHQELKQQCLYGNSGIDPRHKLAAALRWFAGGSYLDIRLVHSMSVAKMYQCVWKTVDAINASEALSFKFPWNTTRRNSRIWSWVLQNLQVGNFADTFLRMTASVSVLRLQKGFSMCVTIDIEKNFMSLLCR